MIHPQDFESEFESFLSEEDFISTLLQQAASTTPTNDHHPPPWPLDILSSSPSPSPPSPVYHHSIHPQHQHQHQQEEQHMMDMDMGATELINSILASAVGVNPQTAAPPEQSTASLYRSVMPLAGSQLESLSKEMRHLHPHPEEEEDLNVCSFWRSFAESVTQHHHRHHRQQHQDNINIPTEQKNDATVTAAGGSLSVPVPVPVPPPPPPPPHTVPQSRPPLPVHDALHAPAQRAPHFVSYIKIVEGFKDPVTKKQPGGRDNTRHRLPRQVIELNRGAVPQSADISTLSVRAQVLGTDRVTKGKVVLGELGEKRFATCAGGTAALDSMRWLAIFDDIIIKFSSHLHGQKLALRFTLHDASRHPISSVDSEEFETITKRGKEKQFERKRKRANDDHDVAAVHSAIPGVGPTRGGQLVKIVGRNFMCPPTSSTVVKFGDNIAREVHSVKRTAIVCETPEGDPGTVDVCVSLDSGRQFLESDAKYQYVDPSDPDRMKQILLSFLSPQGADSSDSTMSDSASQSAEHSSVSSSDSYTLQWLNGLQIDPCGFNIMHHVCARSMFQLALVILANQSSASMSNNLLHGRDNFGRTPLFWALWAGSYPISVLLVGHGAPLDVRDDSSDTPVHIAVQRGHIDALKMLLFWMLKVDDIGHNNARSILSLLKAENVQGRTPMDIALQNYEPTSRMAALLRSMESMCMKRLNSTGPGRQQGIAVNDITVRSGPNAGKSLRENFFQNCKLSLVLENDVLLVNVRGAMADDAETVVSLCAVVPHNKIAFLILEQKSHRAELTLLQPPDVVDTVTGRPVPEDQHPFSMQFHVQVSEAALEHLNRFYTHCEEVYQFNQYCFCRKPDGGTDNAATKNTQQRQESEGLHPAVSRGKSMVLTHHHHHHHHGPAGQTLLSAKLDSMRLHDDSEPQTGTFTPESSDNNNK